MDAKKRYSYEVTLGRIRRLTDEEFDKKIQGARLRKEKYKDNWQSVNINDVVNKFAPGSVPYLNGAKLVFLSLDGKYEVSADLGGGYLRIKDLEKDKCVGLNGENMLNYKNERGKYQGRGKAKYNAVTHFRIKKLQEM